MARFLVGLMILACSVAAAFVLAREQERRPKPQAAAASTDSVTGHAHETATGVVEDAPRAQVSSVLPEPHAWSHALCPDDMVWVGGRHCPRRRADGDGTRCASDERTVSVCMDRHEYPNQIGVLPAVMLDFRGAEAACGAEAKRLCTETEWALACQGTHDVTACNVGRAGLQVRTQELAKADRISVEVATYDGRRPNHEHGCVSDFRVFDLVGNVQEWVISEHRTPHVGALKGGRYNQGSIGCDRSIYVSDPWTRYPHTGLRCCADPLAPAPATSR